MLWTSDGTITGKKISSPQGSATFEQFLLSSLLYLENEENSLQRVSGRTDQITITLSTSQLSTTVTLRLTVNFSIEGNGELLINTSHYLQNSQWEGGSGGTFYVFDNLSQSILSSCILLKSWESNLSKNPQERNSIDYSISPLGEGLGLFECSLRLPIQMVIINGNSVIESQEWLVG